MRARLEFTILGSGSSAGVPRANGDWGACNPDNPKNRRTRCSLMVRRVGEGPPETWTSIIIDTSPEFRLQTGGAGLKRLDAVLFTHDHADQTHGLDDIRTFAMIQRQRIPIHMDAVTEASLMRRFGYIFKGEGGYPAIADIYPLPRHGRPWLVDGPSGPIPVVSFDLDHGGVRSVGYRIGGVAYAPDVVDVPDEAFATLRGLDVWIVDALRWAPHPTHAHVEKSLGWIARAGPRRAILTDMHIDIDYDDLTAKCPPGVEAAYDGMRFEIESEISA